MGIVEVVKDSINDTKFRTIVKFTFVGVVLAHGMAIFNKYLFHDDLKCFLGYAMDATYASGRWGSELLEYFYRSIYGSYNYSLSSYNIFFAAFTSAVMTYLIVSSLDFGNKIQIGLLAVINVTIPAFTSMVGYVFTLQFVYLGYFFATLSVYLFFEYTNKMGFLLGVVLGAFSMGIYQAVVPFMITYALLVVMTRVLCDDFRCSRFINIFVKLFLFFLLILCFYLGALKCSLAIHSAELSSYKGIDTYGITSINGYIQRIEIAYKNFISPPPQDSYNGKLNLFPGSMQIARYLLLGIICCCIIRIIFECIKRRDYSCLVELALLLVVFPMAINFIYIMCPLESINSLTLYSQIFYFVLFILFVGRVGDIDTRLIVPGKIISFLLLSFSALIYIRYANTCYTKTELALEESRAYFIELKTRIESVSGYSSDKEVLFLNDAPQENETLYRLDEFADVSIVPYASGLQKDKKWNLFMKYWTGYEPKLYSGDKLYDDDRIKELPHYPDDGSILVIDDVITVNF